jgi:subtilisin family serine protease
MSSPVVAGVAALLRSAYPDRETYSSKYIHSQLTNTGTKKVSSDSYHSVCNAYEALTNIPSPKIYNLYRFYAFDNVDFSSNNNGDGFIDASDIQVILNIMAAE